jgi:polyferredoxin
MKKSFKKMHKLSANIRFIILSIILSVSTLMGILHQYSKQKPAGVDAMCPFGGVESLWFFLSDGKYLKRVALSSFILLGATILVALIFRRSFCGNYCPLGFLQELFDRLGKKIFRKRFVIPDSIDKYLRYTKYLVLFGVSFLSWRVADLFIRPYDPWAAYHHLWSNELFEEFLFGFIVLVVSFAGSLLYNRFFCKYLCPMGALLGFISKVGLFKVTRNESSCINCSACTKACPVNIDVEKTDCVTTAECINCNRCVDSCPVDNTLYVQFKKVKLSALTVTLATLLIMLSVMGVTAATGDFNFMVQEIESLEDGGEFKIEDIRGRHTFKELSEASGIAAEKFITTFNLTEQQFNGAIKDVTHAENASLDTEEVRIFIAEELGIEYEPKEE